MVVANHGPVLSNLYTSAKITPYEVQFSLSVTSKSARAITQICAGDMFCEDMLIRVGKTGSLGALDQSHSVF